MTRVVSVRLPKALLKELQRSNKKNFYMDLSEQIRSIIRQKSLEYTYPYRSELAKFSKTIENKHSEEQRRAKRDLLKEVQKILEAEV